MYSFSDGMQYSLTRQNLECSTTYMVFVWIIFVCLFENIRTEAANGVCIYSNFLTLHWAESILRGYWIFHCFFNVSVLWENDF